MELMYLIILLVILAIFSVTGVNLGGTTGNMYCFELRFCMRAPQNLHLCRQTHICNPNGLDALVIPMFAVFFLRMSALIQFFQGEIEQMDREWSFFFNTLHIWCQKFANNIIDRKNISDKIFEIKKWRHIIWRNLPVYLNFIGQVSNKLGYLFLSHQNRFDFVSNQSGINCAPEFKFRKNR